MKSRRIQGWVFGMYGENRNMYKVWWGKLKERSTRKTRRRWKGNIENVGHGLDSSG
jgi:ribosomal protein L28